jgi:alpha-tubulin suppressor-like RCC1 family protein
VIVWPSGSPRPTTSNLNVVAGESRPNLVTVRLDQSRKVSLFNALGSVHLLADLAGHYTSGAGALYQPLPPTRVLDTRTGTGVKPRNPDGSLPLNLAGFIPADATAVVFNLTATNVTANTHVIAWPHGKTRPDTSNLNMAPGETRANLVTVALGTDRTVDLFNNLGGIDLIADLAGFYLPGEGLAYYPLDPVRVADTRSTTMRRPDQLLNLVLTWGNYIPHNASAVVMNVTATESTANTHVTVTPGHGFETDASTLNVPPGGTVPNLAAVVVGMLGALDLKPNAGSMHLIVDLAGYFAPAPTTCTTGCVSAWGESSNGSLGSGGGFGQNAYFPEPTPRHVSGLSGVTAIAGRYALLPDGTVRAWGQNNWGQLGVGWHAGSYGFASVPVRVRGLSGITAIAAAESNGYALRSDGTVWGWGENYNNQVGPQTTPDRIVDLPVRIAGIDNVVAIATSWGTAYALRSDGTVWSWGSNSSGDLGIGTKGDSSPTPVQVAGLTDVTEIVAGGDTRYALRSDGTVWTWGNNAEGQLGNGTVSGESSTAAPVRDLTGVVSVGAAYRTGFAVLADRTVVAWGVVSASGTGYSGDRWLTTPKPVRKLTDVTKVVGQYALRTDGSLWGWGGGSAPAPISGLPPVTAVTGSGGSSFVITG